MNPSPAKNLCNASAEVLNLGPRDELSLTVPQENLQKRSSFKVIKQQRKYNLFVYEENSIHKFLISDIIGVKYPSDYSRIFLLTKINKNCPIKEIESLFERFGEIEGVWWVGSKFDPSALVVFKGSRTAEEIKNNQEIFKNNKNVVVYSPFFMNIILNGSNLFYLDQEIQDFEKLQMFKNKIWKDQFLLTKQESIQIFVFNKYKLVEALFDLTLRIVLITQYLLLLLY